MTATESYRRAAIMVSRAVGGSDNWTVESFQSSGRARYWLNRVRRAADRLVAEKKAWWVR
jgi:hypothetical protein